MVHVRELEGRTLTFGHRGWLWHNAYLLYDHETDSIWHHQTGWAMSGPLRGKSLRRFPTTQSTFAAWIDAHPDSLVLPKPPDHPGPVDVDVYARRNAGLEFGLGLDLPASFRLYPLAAVAAAGGLVQDTVEGVPIVVVQLPQQHTTVAYDRRVDGTTLDLELHGSPAALRERGGTRRWNALSGKPIDGRGDDEALRPLLSSPWEVVAWRSQHPSGSVWRATR